MRNSYYRIADCAWDGYTCTMRLTWSTLGKALKMVGFLQPLLPVDSQSTWAIRCYFTRAGHRIRAVGEDISIHLPCTISWRNLSSAPERNPSYILIHDAKQTNTKAPRNSLIQACGLKGKSENSKYSPVRATQVFECLWTIYGLKQTLLLYDSS
jgi:hypothetical protein